MFGDVYTMSAFQRSKEPEFDFIFTIARMNPPTPGHKELVKQMMITAVDNGNKPVYIGLSSTCCKEDNPLTCDEKKALVESMILQIRAENAELQQVITKVICSDDVGSAIMFNLTSKIITDYYGNETKANGLMFFGDDYVGCENSQGITECLIEDPKINYSKLKSQFDHMFFAPPLVRKTDSNKTLTLANGTEIPLPSAGMSATFIRNLTLENEAEFNKKIAKHYQGTGTNPDVLRVNQKEIFNTIMSKAISDIETRIISKRKNYIRVNTRTTRKRHEKGNSIKKNTIRRKRTSNILCVETQHKKKQDRWKKITPQDKSPPSQIKSFGLFANTNFTRLSDFFFFLFLFLDIVRFNGAYVRHYLYTLFKQRLIHVHSKCLEFHYHILHCRDFFSQHHKLVLHFFHLRFGDLVLRLHLCRGRCFSLHRCWCNFTLHLLLQFGQSPIDNSNNLLK
jgi:hypothetical protein